MTKRLATAILAAMMLVAGVSPAVRADDLPSSGATLKAITAISLLVERLPDGAKKLGLSEETIQNDVELRLRLAGMRVIPWQERYKIKGSPFLYVNIFATDSALAACVEVELHQVVFLPRTGEVAENAITWSKGWVAASPNSQYIRDNVKDIVDAFLNAWLSVNPKK